MNGTPPRRSTAAESPNYRWNSAKSAGYRRWSSVLFDTGGLAVKRIPTIEPSRGTKKLVGEIFKQSDTAVELLNNIAG